MADTRQAVALALVVRYCAAGQYDKAWEAARRVLDGWGCAHHGKGMPPCSWCIAGVPEQPGHPWPTSDKSTPAGIPAPAQQSESREASAMLPLRELLEESRAWCGRHAPDCKAKPDPAFGAAYVDAPDCTCYVRPLYLFEVNGDIPLAAKGTP